MSTDSIIASIGVLVALMGAFYAVAKNNEKRVDRLADQLEKQSIERLQALRREVRQLRRLVERRCK